MKVLMTGGTGFVGRHLQALLASEGHTVVLVSRRAGVGRTWEPGDVEAGVAAADAVVHLAGAGVLDRRWTDAYRDEILRSRVETTERIAAACASSGRRLVSTSAVGYYGTHPMGHVLDESSPPGDGFLARVCVAWEAAAAPAAASLAIVRVGIVLGPDGGALAQMLIPFRLGAGGPIGDGRQPFPWVHIDDVCRLYTWLLAHPEHTGVFNAVAPEVCKQRTFARTLGRVLGRPALLPTPAFALRLALGERGSVLSTGQHVVPRRTLEAGFRFEHPKLEPGLRDLLAR